MKKKFTLLTIVIFICANAQEGTVDSKLIKNGMYVESFAGVAATDFTDGNLGIGLKFGNVWYFGSSDFWRPGFKTVWFRMAGYFGEDGTTVQGSILNVGFANIIEFKQNFGLEANINFGYNFIHDNNDNYKDYNQYYDDDVFWGGGIMINPEIKFRYHILAIGIDFVFSNAINYDDHYNYNYNNSDPLFYYNKELRRETSFTAINISVGVKF